MKGLWIAALLVSASAVAAQDGTSLGEMEYNNSCVVCHGTDGKGGGPFAQHLATRPPSLTTLAQSNDGVFPVSDVYAIIDGSADVSLHGGRSMPIWGRRYAADLQSDMSAYYSPEEAKAFATTRILALIEYLASIQE